MALTVVQAQAPRRKQVKEALAERITESIKRSGSVDIPEVVHDTISHFEQDENFLRELVYEIFYPDGYQQARKIIAQTRNEAAVTHGDEVVARSEFEERAATRFERWVVNVAPHRDVLFMKMEREDLIQWRAKNDNLASHYEINVGLADRLLKPLKEGQKVEEVFTAEEIEGIYQEVKSLY